MPLPDAVACRAVPPRLGAKPGLGLRLFHRALVACAEAAAPGHACLPRSLALFGEARARGLDVRLVVGVRADGGDVASHAWVLLDGEPFLEVPETATRWRPLVTLPTAP